MEKFKYRVNEYRTKIEKLEITKESEHSIWIKNQQYHERKNTQSNQHFDSWEDAFSFLQLRVIQELERSKSRLESAQKNFDIVSVMEPS